MPRIKLCWDACVFIALLMGEERTQEEVDGLLETVDLADRGEAVICTSSLIFAEVLSDESDRSVREKLQGLFRRPNFLTLDLNSSLAAKAAEIRESAIATGRRLQTPDSIFLATALAYRADAFHTFDGKLLSLNRSDCVEGLVICKPQASQTLLGL